jgi:hypothetical protein
VRATRKAVALRFVHRSVARLGWQRDSGCGLYGVVCRKAPVHPSNESAVSPPIERAVFVNGESVLAL